MGYVNHVALPVEGRMEACTRFYVSLFGAEVIPSPAFSIPVVWLKLGDTQIHLADRPGPFEHYHFGITIDDFEEVYRRAKEDELFDRTTFGHHIYELPGGNVQMYLLDPAGNIVECDWPDVATLSPEIVGDLKRWADICRQSDWNNRSTLFFRTPLPIG